jgi:ribonuclease-3
MKIPLIRWIKGEDSVDPSIKIDEIEKKIQYKFHNKQLLTLAFKHKSYLNQTQEESYYSNERLEFLGDAVLDLIVTEYLYKKYPQENEGVLSQKKSVLVSRSVLGKVIRLLLLGQFLLLDKGEEKTGGKKRHSNLANLFEAVLGAIYLDGGFEKARIFVNQFLLVKSDNYLAVESYQNYKSALLEYSQGNHWGPPVYKVIKESGPDHKKTFYVEAVVNDTWKAVGVGSSKKKAQQEAAMKLIKMIQGEKNSNIKNVFTG